MLEVQVTPKAKRERWTTSELGSLRFYTTTPPVDGKANAALIKAVAEKLRIPRSKIELVRGMTSRAKMIAIDTELTKEFVVAKIIE